MTSLCIAARISGTPEATLVRIRKIAHEYSDSDFVEMEGNMTALMSTTPNSSSGANVGDTGIATFETLSPERGGRTVPIPTLPPGILSRFSPIGATLLPPDVELVILTTPMAIAGHLLDLLPALWVEKVVAVVQNLLFVVTLVSHIVQ